ncbi:MAG: DUF4340 domain-containing protein [Myxococcota bacterium]
MSGRTQRTLVPAALFLILGAGAAAWAYKHTYRGKLDETAAERTQGRLFDFVPAYVLSGSLKSSKVDFGFVQKDGSFSLSRPIAAPADEEAIAAVLVRVAGLGLETEISASATDAELATYGMAPADVQLEIVDQQNHKLQLLVGDKNEMRHTYYVAARVDGGPWRLGSAPQDFYWALDRDLYAFRSKRLFRARREDLAKIRVEKAGQLAYQLEKVGKTWKVGAGGKSWDADQAMSERFLLILTRDLKAEAVVTDAYVDADAARYGLDKPAFVVTAESIHGAVDRVRFGVRPGEGTKPDVFACADGSESVAKAYPDFVQDVDKTAQDFRDRGLANFDSDQARRVEITLGGQKPIVLVRQGEDAGGARWAALSPKKGPVKSDRVAAMLLRLGHLRSDALVLETATDAEKQERGLLPPERRILILGPSGAPLADLSVGKPMDKDRVFIAAAQIPRVDAIRDMELKLVPYALDEILEETAP